ncbi:hypothetical protein GCM10027048_11290 [Hymenobacter coalescens]
MNTPYFDSLVLFHDPNLRLLYHRWRGHYNMHRFQAAAEYVQGWLRQYHVESWIVDLNDLPNLGLEEQAWISDELVPSVAPLTALRQLALVLSPNVYNQLTVESLLHSYGGRLGFEVQFFADAPAAFEWLINPTSVAATPFPALLSA